MTPLETVKMVRMLTDDSRDWYPTLDYVNKAINEAQMLIIRKYYQSQQERALRELYRNTGYISNGSQILSSDSPPRGLLYPRACRKKTSITHSDQTSHIIPYIDKDIYLNYLARADTEGAKQPKFSYYTVVKEYRNGALVDVLYFTNSSGEVADLWFISYPPQFVYNNSPSDVGLSLSPEYHFEIAALAAEIINDIDVGEMERGNVGAENQRLNLEGLAL